jgi:hypothetical protein
MATKNNIEEARRVYEEAIEEKVRTEILYDEEGTLHKECYTEEEILDARAEEQEAAEEVWEALQKFGGHTADCCQGIFRGEKLLHRLCTCGWNHFATEVERRAA